MKLLIVEDNKEILESLKESFQELGYMIDSAEDGATALYKAKVNKYDLIILDIGLPIKDGRAVCHGIRSSGGTMPIIILSVKSEIESKTELFAMGADDYVVKPFSFAELAARVKACLRRPVEIKEEIITVKNITLNKTSRIAFMGEKQIHFTPKEFFMLEYLMNNKGRVISRQEILEHIWGEDTDPFTNTVEMHVANIRRKTKNDSVGANLITTISSGGYLID